MSETLAPPSRGPATLAPPSRIPPGFPLRYTRSQTLLTCGCCGTSQTTERLFGVFRTLTTATNGSMVPGTVTRPLGASELLYRNIPVETTTLRAGTPTCPRCIDLAFARAEPVPLLPEPQTRLNWLGGRHAATSSPKPAKAKTLDDILL